ncbi:hypothetical protein D3C76_1351810 [compost metagenome]
MTGIRRDALGDIDSTTTAHSNQAVVAALAIGAGAVLDDGNFRLRFDLIEDAVTATAQLRQRQINSAGLQQNDVGDDQRVLDIQASQFS